MDEKTYPSVVSHKSFKELTDGEKNIQNINGSISTRWALFSLVEEQWGEEGKQLVIKTLREIGHGAAKSGLERLHGEGKYLDQKLGEVTDVGVYTEIMAPGRSAFLHDYNVIEVRPNLAIHILYNCPDPAIMRKESMPCDVCWTYYGAVERGIVEALNPKMKMDQTHSLYRGPDNNGDPICLYTVEIEE